MFRLIVVCVSLMVIVSVLLIKHFTQDKVSEEVKVVKKPEKKITEVKKKVVFTSVSEKKAHFF